MGTPEGITISFSIIFRHASFHICHHFGFPLGSIMVSYNNLKGRLTTVPLLTLNGANIRHWGTKSNRGMNTKDLPETSLQKSPNSVRAGKPPPSPGLAKNRPPGLIDFSILIFYRHQIPASLFDIYFNMFHHLGFPLGSVLAPGPIVLASLCRA